MRYRTEEARHRMRLAQRRKRAQLLAQVAIYTVFLVCAIWLVVSQPPFIVLLAVVLLVVLALVAIVLVEMWRGE